VVAILDIAEPSRLSVVINDKSKELGCTVYSLDLTLPILSSHMEDELGLSDDKGLGAFGRPFATALRSGKLQYNQDDAHNTTSKLFPLELTYNIGSIIVHGTLHLALVAREMSCKLFSIIYTPPTAIASILAQTADVTISSELDSSSFRNRDIGESNASQSVQLSQSAAIPQDPDSEAEDRVVVAKRRKLTGTKLFRK
jgi:hypothetical protein